MRVVETIAQIKFLPEFTHRNSLRIKQAEVAKLVDAPDLGSGSARIRGSSPLLGILCWQSWCGLVSVGMHTFREELRELAAAAASHGVLLGTSSWKYPGWMGQLYEEQRYLWRGRIATTRFERDCLREYAEVLPTVCVDAAYYRFPDAGGLQALAEQVPAGFRFSFKVTEDITVKQFPRLPKHGAKAGMVNPHFLNAELFTSAFLQPCAAIRDYVGLLIFEFSPFHPKDFARGRDFVEALEVFLGQLPQGWNYGVEIRNRTFLHPEYFAMLARHGVTHVFNSWSAMPGVEEQWEMPGSITRPDCVAARLLLKPGRKYQQAVEAFSPYEKVQEPLPAVRAAAAKMVQRGQRLDAKGQTLIYVNNRLEGNALQTIRAVLAQTRTAG